MEWRGSTIVSAIAVAAICVFIFVMSALPADDSTALSTGVIWHIVGFIVPGYDQMSAAEQLHWQEALQFPVRKTAHFSEYALLGFLTLNLAVRLPRLQGMTRGRQAGIAWAFSVLYSISDEVHQVFVPGRTCKIMDVGIDAAGALAGIALLTLILWLIGRSRRRSAR